jgi:hypothetical protein
MSAKTLWRSFAAGEISPELYGRIDLAKFQTGLKKCLNFTVLPHGPADRRPGLRYCVESRTSTSAVRLIPFAYSAEQTVILEFGDQYVRFLVEGEALLEANQAIVSIVGSTVTVTGHGWATGDDVFIGTRFHRITVTGADTFTTADLWGNATTAAGATAARVYTLATPYVAADLFDLHYAQNSDVLTITHPTYAARELARLGATNWTLTAISFTPSATVPTGVGVVATIGTPGNLSPQRYVITALGADGVTESLASAVAATSNNLSVAGNFNTVSWSAVVGATRYNVYKQRGGSFGYIGQTTSLSIVDDNVLADTTKTPPEDIYELNTGAGDYPSAVTYYEQRRWFGGTTDEPQNVWATRNGTESNLTSSLPSQEDDGLEFRIAARQQNAIRHLLPLADMIALTVGGEFRIFADNAPNITPTSLSIKPQGYSGASNVQPALTSSSILYIQAQGSRVREMAYNWQSNAYTSIDISIMAPHLFNGYTVRDLAYVRSPIPTLWAVRSDGTLLGMTYVPEQQVYGWHQHTTPGGVFESVAVVSEGNEDVLYVLVRRTVDGRDVRYIERMGTRVFVNQEDAFYVDSGLTYDGAPTTTLTGLWHLEGETVQVLLDGAVHPDRTVTAGSITLEEEGSVVHVGLGYVSDLETLPLAFEGAPAMGQYMRKNVNGVAIRYTNSNLLKAGPTYARLTDYPERDVSDPYGSPPALRTGEARMSLPAEWNSDARVCIRQDKPVPLTVLSLALEVATGG